MLEYITPPHTPVLLNEVKRVFSGLNGVIIDCTLGFGSHSYALLNANKNIKVIGIDQDDEALLFATQRLSQFKERFQSFKGRFSNICAAILKEQKVEGILADIGVSSYQLDNKERGFGFQSSSLDMRMDRSQILDAKKIVNYYPKHELERIFKEYGEVHNYKKLALLITTRRTKKPFESAQELAQFIAQHSYHKGSIHPATLPFQALRIEVNQELEELKKLLHVVKGKTKILALISFHSLEDRIIKKTFKEFAQTCICPQDSLQCTCGNIHSLGDIITKKPIMAPLQEVCNNKRSRSAKMRVFHFKDCRQHERK